MINLHSKFEVSSLSRSSNILGGQKFKMGNVKWPHLFRNSLTSVDQIWSLYVQPLLI